MSDMLSSLLLFLWWFALHSALQIWVHVPTLPNTFEQFQTFLSMLQCQHAQDLKVVLY